MKRSAIIVLLSVSVFILSLPAASFAEHKKGEGYIAFKGGIYSPTSEDLRDAGFKSDFNLEAVVGMYANKNLALEFGSGYFQTEASVSGASGSHEEDDISVVPVIATIKAVLPIDFVELYGGGGNRTLCCKF